MGGPRRETANTPESARLPEGSYAIVPSVGAKPEPGVQLYTLAAGLFGLAGLLWFSASLTLVVFTSLMWLQAALKLGAAGSGARSAPERELWEWPTYTLLLPLHDEAQGVPRLVAALQALDYPRDKLDIRFLCEADDHATLAAVRAARMGRLVVVPPGGPRTKPNALSYAMRERFGEFVTIYDAEDSPHPEQLKTAARAFAANPGLVAVQAPLHVDNSAPRWITRQFAMEYAALFHVWLPWLVAHDLPIPLGGTSNHIRTSALEAAGGWDPYNVTEDADLTYRLALDPRARFGWIAPPTREEAVATSRAWHGQRTRWLKGFAQTWIAHARQSSGKAGLKRAVSLHITIGLTLLSALFHVPVMVLSALLYLSGTMPGLVVTGVGSLLYASGIAVCLVGSRRAGLSPKPIDLLTVPFYWWALTLPAWAAVWELIFKPHYWNKTAHGVSAREEPA